MLKSGRTGHRLLSINKILYNKSLSSEIPYKRVFGEGRREGSEEFFSTSFEILILFEHLFIGWNSRLTFLTEFPKIIYFSFIFVPIFHLVSVWKSYYKIELKLPQDYFHKFVKKKNNALQQSTFL